ncbi:60S ribosomal protein L18a, partial [Fragariocoptes setiger]
MGKDVMRQFRIIGRKLPSDKDLNPPLFRMTVYAPDHVVAKSRFWYFMRKLNKVKKTAGQVVSVQEIYEKNPMKKVKNYGVWLRYDSRTGTHNMYREYRELSVAEAVSHAYRDMGARHSARASCIQIIRVKPIAAGKCRRPHVKQFHNSKIKFPLPQSFDRKLKRFTTKRPKARLI